MNRIELDIWEPTRENPRMLAYVGQRTAQEVFKELQQRLESSGYLPDEYFLMGSEWEKGREIPKDSDIFCTTDYGSSEGIYIDVYLKWFDKQEQSYLTKSFATGKTLGESESDLDRMFLIASAITKAFHSDGVHARYIRLGTAEEPESTVIHMDVSERRLLIDSLVDKRNRLKDETQAVEQLLRRVTGSITEYVNEIGERPLKICDFDLAVIAIHDGNLPAFRDVYQKVPDKTGELLIHAAARPGNVGREMTKLLLAEAKDIPNDMYLEACKGAAATGDQERILFLAEQAATCIAEPDMSLHGKLLVELSIEHKNSIARALLEQCSPEHIKAADPYLMIMALRNWDYNMADKLAKNGIDANKYAYEIIYELRTEEMTGVISNIFWNSECRWITKTIPPCLHASKLIAWRQRSFCWIAVWILTAMWNGPKARDISRKATKPFHLFRNTGKKKSSILAPSMSQPKICNGFVSLSILSSVKRKSSVACNRRFFRRFCDLNVTEKQLISLAKRIATAGKSIAKDPIAKDYLLEGKNYGSIFVTSDSGFEAIVIGDVRPSTGNGFMYLYYQNTERRNSYPNVKTIAALLRNVLEKERLEEGEGKAAYHDWPEYGGLEKQLIYFAGIVRRMASK